MAYEYKTNAQKAHTAKKQSGRIPKEVCKKRMFGKPCKRCSQVAKLAQSNDEDDKTIASKVKAKSTYYMNIVPMVKGNSKVEKVNRIYPSGISNWRDMIANLPDSDGDGFDFTDPSQARPIILERKGKGRSTTYTLKISEKRIKVPESFLKKMFPLHKILDYIDNDDLFFIPDEGKNKFLVLPPWGKEADGEFWKEGFFHWNVDLLDGMSDDSSGSGSDDLDEDDFGDESFSEDDSKSDDFDEDEGTDDFKEDNTAGTAGDDFDDFDEKEEKFPKLDEMGKEALVKFAETKGIKLSAKALAAPEDKLRAYLKKKETESDIPW
ncbi:MAG: hypothetical protein KAS39_02190 [Actinomycetia bacterium]|nr:hypothetical protein [Actinomycetes bacterium]